MTEIGGEENQMKILTRPATFQHPVGSNVTMPCAVLNLGQFINILYCTVLYITLSGLDESLPSVPANLALFMAIANDLAEIRHENWIIPTNCSSQTILLLTEFQISRTKLFHKSYVKLGRLSG